MRAPETANLTGAARARNWVRYFANPDLAAVAV